MVFASGLQGALLMAQGRIEGLRYVAADESGAARSFWAAAVALPLFLLLRLAGEGWDVGAALAPHGLLLAICGYVIGWVGFALLSRPLVHAMGKGEHWPRFIVAWNWCNVVQNLLLVGALPPDILGAPPWVGEAAWLVALGWALWLEWFAVRLTLGVGVAAAAVIVGVDALFGIFVDVLTTGG
jgi:hypothetical protein